MTIRTDVNVHIRDIEPDAIRCRSFSSWDEDDPTRLYAILVGREVSIYLPSGMAPEEFVAALSSAITDERVRMANAAVGA